MKIYDSKFKRTLMRFLEIILLGGLSALLFSPEFEGWIYAAFGTAIGAALLKLLRELLKRSNE